MDLQITYDFLTDLAKNNKKEWMDANKKRYNQAKDQVVELVADILKQSSEFEPDLANLDPRKTLFRINRDIRFSTNKDPYKTNFGASLTPGGKKTGRPGYYLHLKPGENFYGGGLYQPESAILQKIRQEIDYNGGELKSIIDDAAFKKTYDEPYIGDKLKTAPKGYPKDHEFIELLRLKHYVYMRNATEEEVMSEGFSNRVVDAFRLMLPFNKFLERGMD